MYRRKEALSRNSRYNPSPMSSGYHRLYGIRAYWLKGMQLSTGSSVAQ